MTSPPRRSLETYTPEDTRGRWGCIGVGAVLGIVIGAMFAFYGLPPILRSIYGESRVGAGESYSGDAKEIRVAAVLRNGSEVRVTLDATTNKTWWPEASDFSLELSTGGDWIEAQPPSADDPATALSFELGVRRELVLVFVLPPGREGDPKALHLSSPRVRFGLEE